MLRPVAAFVAVAAEADTGNETEVQIEQPEKVHRQAVFRRPAVRRADAAGLERLLLRLMANADAVFTVRAEAKLDAFVRIDLEVEIAGIRTEGKEEFHAAVLVNRTERRTVFRTDCGLPSPLADIEHRFIVTELLRHADAAVRLPEDRVDRQRRDGIPVRSTAGSWNEMCFHIALPPR